MKDPLITMLRLFNSILQFHLFTLILQFSFHLPFITCAILPATNIILQNNTFTALQNNTTTILSFLARPPTVHCSFQPAWTDIPGFGYHDCFGTIYKMAHDEMSSPPHGANFREFKTRAARSAGQLGEPLLTPRKYVVGKF